MNNQFASLQLQNMNQVPKGVGELLSVEKDAGKLLQVDFKLTQCKFATKSALFDVSGIVNGNK